MKKIFIVSMASIFITSACTSSDNKTTTQADKDTAVVVDNDQRSDTALNGRNANNNTTNNANTGNTNTQQDADFVTKAADGGMLEVNLGDVAQKNATAVNVKDFGAMMLKDHSKANAELKTLAQKLNISIPTRLSEKSQNKLKEMTAIKGADFNKKYIDDMVMDHEEDIMLFKQESENGTKAELKAFAAKTLPILNHHLEMVKKMKDGMK